MSLTQALSSAVSGLKANQAGLSIVAGNVANAGTPGYVRKTPTLVTSSAGELGIGVRIAAINRELDSYVQRQLRVESSGLAYADLRAQFYHRLQSLYGEPGSVSALETVFNDFTRALQGLSNNPELASARTAVISAAELLTGRLNSMTGQVQDLRAEAELGIADAVGQANEAMQQIVRLNQQLAASPNPDAATASLLDRRDFYVDQLAELMDIRVIEHDPNQLTIFTNTGIELVGTHAAQLAFDPQGTMTAETLWSADSTQRAVGTIKLLPESGGEIDLIAIDAIRSGKIATYIEMRDRTLVEAQTQLDEIAATLARALSDRTTPGTPVVAGAQTGFDIDIGALLAGNSVSLAYTPTAGAQQRVTIVRVDDPAALPLANSDTSDGNDMVVGVTFAGGLASIVAQLSAALGSSMLQFSNPGGTTLRILDDGGGGQVNVDSVSATATVTTLTGGTAELPFFHDQLGPYTGAITSTGQQRTGLAGRIVVNAALAADPSRLVVFQTVPLTPAGDTTRPNFIFDRLVNAAFTYAPQSSIGSLTAPFSASLPAFMRQIISQQGEATVAADSLKAGQEVVYNALRERFNEDSGVNIDEEMTNLLTLQNAYAANARVLSAVKDMLESLLNM
jgi:flagellar hook-associated protein 1 FlgK